MKLEEHSCSNEARAGSRLIADRTRRKFERSRRESDLRLRSVAFKEFAHVAFGLPGGRYSCAPVPIPPP
jgi:hypothetical protein